MEPIRYTQRICEDKEKINRFLTETRVGTLSMWDGETGPYALPVNYIYWNGNIYFHGMGSGKKNDLLAKNPAVCFTVFEEFGTVVDPVPAKCDTAYLSVVIFGKAVPVQDLEEKTGALAVLMEKFLPGFFKNSLSPAFVEQYRSSFDNNAVAVYRICPEVLTAKENSVDKEQLFPQPQK
ncbi:MAG TPA: pyridoxamine 5'-phosphate oxidase family protein [Methylomusa anaerophila]|uniref:Pyridoxamine 5'-phosphate oxidase n=1 Tax=Methylomusa anaerophila TaxID=1930071 RepID=A0A348AG12_9FIRM|nr:pyridoxamine 5'-phosphate oxidase family protein [Methylomusa anaerophila]BBB90010.1 pyridoxamine 5'-phosphate oxidase [Methylomusa anaerophila]HML88262.1 pyridoxamine 5'-phosphate oxidase family protein [Methylomusa anaerophila]